MAYVYKGSRVTWQGLIPLGLLQSTEALKNALAGHGYRVENIWTSEAGFSWSDFEQKYRVYVQAIIPTDFSDLNDAGSDITYIAQQIYQDVSNASIQLALASAPDAQGNITYPNPPVPPDYRKDDPNACGTFDLLCQLGLKNPTTAAGGGLLIGGLAVLIVIVLMKR